MHVVHFAVQSLLVALLLLLLAEHVFANPLALEYLANHRLLVRQRPVKRLAELEKSHCFVRVTNRAVFADVGLDSADLRGVGNIVKLDARQRLVADFVRQGHFVLAIIEVPDVKPAVFASDKEQARASR